MGETTNDKEVELYIGPVDLPPAVAELIEEAENEIEYARAEAEAKGASRRALVNALVSRQTAKAVTELGSQLPEALRPYVSAADDPIVEMMATDTWIPSALKVEIPGVSVFYLGLGWIQSKLVIVTYYQGDSANHYGNRRCFRSLGEVLVESRHTYLAHIDRHNDLAATAVAQRHAESEFQKVDERQPTTAERLVALIEEIATRKVAELLEV